VNLSDLTEAVRCRDCGGHGEQTHRISAGDPHNVDAGYVRCSRCSDHPGIDPDAIRSWSRSPDRHNDS